MGDERPEARPVRVRRQPAATDAQLPAPLVLTFGILGGVHLIYVVGWVTALQRLNAISVASSDVVTQILFPFGEALAIISPVVWFAAAFVLTRGRRQIVRLLWLLAGLIAVAPWPFILGSWAQ